MGRGLRPAGIAVAALALLALPVGTAAPPVNLLGPGAVPTGYHGVEANLPKEYLAPRKIGGSCTIGFQNPDVENVRYLFVQLAVVHKGNSLRCRVIALDDALSSQRQVANMAQLLTQKVGAIIFYPLSGGRDMRAVLQQARDANVPVVAIDASFGTRRTAPLIATQVWDGLDIQAYLQARLLRKTRPNAKVGLIGLAIPVPAINYLKSREAYWAKKIDHATIVASKANPSGDVGGGEHAAKMLLDENASINAVLCYNDASALGTVAVAGRRNLKVIGNDASPVGLAATVRGDPVGVGVQTAIAAYSLISKQHLPLPDVVLRPGGGVESSPLQGGPVSWQAQVNQIGG